MTISSGAACAGSARDLGLSLFFGVVVSGISFSSCSCCQETQKGRMWRKPTLSPENDMRLLILRAFSAVSEIPLTGAIPPQTRMNTEFLLVCLPLSRMTLVQ